MLRVGLTGGLGSGKSTVAAMFAEMGARVLHADEIGREMMSPGESVYGAIVERFGRGVLLPETGGGAPELDRRELARIAFGEGRVEELNAIVHPAVIARQAEMMDEIAAQEPRAIAVVESALIFETVYGGEQDGAQAGAWRRRFDRIVLVTAPEESKVERYVARALAASAGTEVRELEAEARRRLARQMRDEEKIAGSDYVIGNSGDLRQLQKETVAVWRALCEERDRRTDGARVLP